MSNSKPKEIMGIIETIPDEIYVSSGKNRREFSIKAQDEAIIQIKELEARLKMVKDGNVDLFDENSNLIENLKRAEVLLKTLRHDIVGFKGNGEILSKIDEYFEQKIKDKL